MERGGSDLGPLAKVSVAWRCSLQNHQLDPEPEVSRVGAVILEVRTRVASNLSECNLPMLLPLRVFRIFRRPIRYSTEAAAGSVDRRSNILCPDPCKRRDGAVASHGIPSSIHSQFITPAYTQAQSPV
jgi:hypothetical protein